MQTRILVVEDNEVLLAGFDGYLSKPIEPELFVGKIGVRRGVAPHRTAIPPDPAPRTGD